MTRKLQFLLSFFLLLGCQTVYMKMTMFPGEELITATCLCILLILVVIQIREEGMVFKKKALKKFGLNCFLLNTIVIMIFTINFFFPYKNSVQITSLKDNIMILGLVIAFFDLIYFYFFTRETNRGLFIKDIINIVFGINLMSLLFYVLGPTLNILSPTNMVNVSWAKYFNISSYFGLFFVAQPGSYSILNQGRNTGLFIEGPMYAFVISIALLFELFLTKDRKPYRVLIGLVALFTTYSTTGFIVIAIALLFYVIDNMSKMKRSMKFAFTILLPILFFVAYFFISKILNEKINMGHSDEVRMNNISSALKNWLSRPIVGYGFKAERRANLSGHTSVFSQVVQDGGIMFLFYYIHPIFIFIKKALKSRNLSSLFFMVCYLILILNTVVTYTTISITILALFLTFGISNEGEIL